MKKSDIAGRVADRIELSRSGAGNAVDALFEAVGEALANGEEVRIVGFGTFTPKCFVEIPLPVKGVPTFWCYAYWVVHWLGGSGSARGVNWSEDGAVWGAVE